MKIYAPVKDANGVYASVRFVNGVGETDNPRLIEWFRTHGYKVPIEDDQTVGVTNIDDESEFVDINRIVDDEEEIEEVEMMGYSERTPDFDSMTPDEIRDWAKAHDMGVLIRNTRNKEKLIEIIKQNWG